MSLFDRAKREVTALEAHQIPDDPTGIPWEDFDRHWDDMIPAVRDSYAKSQILPKLRGEKSFSPAFFSPSPSPPDELPATEIRALIEASLKSTSLPGEPAPAPAPAVSLLDENQTRILLEARDRARARRVDGG